MNISLRRWVVVEPLPWLGLMARMRRGLANAPAPAAAPMGGVIRPDDLVRTQRDLVVGARRIACGSVGTVVGLRRRPLVEVRFADAAAPVTIAGYELLSA